MAITRPGAVPVADKAIRKAKRSETRSDSQAFRTLMQNFFSFFRFFLLPIKAKLKERIFALFCFISFRFFFVLFSLHFIFVSLQMRKQAKNTFFASKPKNFASISLHFASKRK
jgi:hypothetical protein